jgi:DNA-binding HxlR family transcriptional regulator
METDGLIDRKIYQQIPPKVEYSVTEKGRSLYPILEMMCEWGENNIDDRFAITNPQCTEEKER